MHALKIAAITLLSLVPATAQVCTPLSFPAIIVQGQTFQPAIVNGIDQVTTNSVRFQYTSNSTSNAVLIVYATAAQWTANGNKIIAGTAGTNYSSFQGTYPIGNTPAGSIFGNNITNLAANTTYYIAGLASSNGGTNWCPEVDEPFTTPPWTAVQKPAAPQTFDLTPPAITGTDYTIGTAPCNVGATAYAQFVDCITNEISLSQIAAGQNIGIGITPGTPIVVPVASGAFSQWPVPPSAIAVTPNSPAANCWTYSTTNVGGGSVTLTNGEQIRAAASYQSEPPSPINQAVTYSVLNVNGTCGANSFQISQDGSTPLTLADSGGGGTKYIVPWPISQGYIVIHSTASLSNLPPAGVRLDPVAYGSQLGIIEGSGPMLTPIVFSFTSHLWFQDIELTIQANPAAANETDPPPSGFLFQIGTMSDHLVFNQTWEHGPPVPDGLGYNGWLMAGSDNAVINSYTDNVENWRPSDDLNPTVAGTNTLALNAGTGNSGSYYSPSSPTSHYTCSPSATITIGGTAGAFFVSLVPSTCAITVTATTGVTAAGAGVTLVSTSTPGYPRDTNSICVGAHGKGCYSQLNVGAGTWTGSAITGYQDTNCCGNGPAMASDWASAGATGIGLAAGTGPWEIINNFFSGFSIVGPFRDQDFNNGCPGATQCPEIANTIDLTVQRNTFEWDPNYISTSPTWNGSWWFGRNGPEVKQGDRVLYDGNIIGPIYSGLGGGECMDLFTYNGATEGEYLLTPLSEFTSDIEFRNNTCVSTGAGIQMSGGSTNDLMPGWGIHRVWIHNNLFDNTNGYLANPPIPHPQAGAHGYGIALVATQDITIEHNTWAPNTAGDGSAAVQIEITQSGSLSIQNNIFNYDASSGTPGFSFNTTGQAEVPIPAPAPGAQGNALLSYLNNVNLSNNIFLCTWSNDQPSSLVEITPSACSSTAALYPANNYFPNSGTTLANRVSAIGWKTPLSYGAAGGDYRLRELSSYISGSHLASDGFDVGANIDQLEAAQGKVSNVRTDELSSTGATVEFTAPDSAGITVDWGTSAFWTGSGAWTRVANAGGQRAQTVTLTGLPAHALIYYRVNGTVMQPTGTVQLP